MGLLVQSLSAADDSRRRLGCLYSYQVYGIPIRSDIRFPLEESEAPVEAAVELLRGAPSVFHRALRGLTVEPDSENWYEHLALPDNSIYLRWPGLFEFLVSPDGRRITCHPLPQASLVAFETYLLGQVLSFSLLRLGYEILHATAVIVDGYALAFLGRSGHGKSSLAAAFLSAGYPLLTDDLLVLAGNREQVLVPPGLPRIKLLPETAERVLPLAISGGAMNPLTEKRVIPLAESHFWRAPAPLGAIYILPHPSSPSPQRRVRIARSPARTAFRDLLAGTFNVRPQEPARLKRHFESASMLQETIPIRRIYYQRELEYLPDVRDAIVADFRRIRDTSAQSILADSTP